MTAAGADLFARQAAAHPDKTAVIDDRPGGPLVQYTFTELDGLAEALAVRLRELGAEATTKVAWCGPNSAELLVAIGAIRKIGAVAVPLGYRLTPAEAGHVLDHSDVEIAYVDADCADLIERAWPQAPKLRHVVLFDADGNRRIRTADSAVPVPHGDVRDCDIFYTSGTTGRPKGAVRAVDPNPARSPLIELMGCHTDDVYLTTGPLYHSGPARFATMALALGSTIVVQHKFSPQDWLRLVSRYRVTSTFSAPTALRAVCNLSPETKAEYDRSSMRRFIGNAAPWTPALKRRYLADFPEDSLWEVYGAAEFGVATVLPPADQLRKPGSCGRAVPGIDVVLFDERGNEVTEPYAMGELFVRSPAMFRTYYRAHDQYEADRHDDLHTVGDIAYADDDGYLYIADRKKDIVISGGVNIYSAEIEAELEQSPDIREVAVFGVPDEYWGEHVHAAVVPEHPGVTEVDVLDFARLRLAAYKCPRGVSFHPSLPKTGSGKVLKRTLRADVRGDGAVS